MFRVELNLVPDGCSQLPPEAHTCLNVGTALFQGPLSSCEMSMYYREQDAIALSVAKGA